MPAPRLVTRAELLIYLGGIGGTTLAKWIESGRVPGPVPGTTRWDLRAVDRALDRASGLPTLTAANEAGDDPDAADRQRLDAMFGIGGADEDARPTPRRTA